MVKIMEYNINELSNKINDYFSGILSKVDFGKWAEHAYYNLITGGYIEQNKIVIYPFLKTISKIHVEINEKNDIYPVSEDKIKSIQSILNGNESFCCQIVVAIPKHIYMNSVDDFLNDEKREIFDNVRKKITQFINKEIYEKELCENIKKILYYPCPQKTILDILYKQILNLSMGLFDFKESQLNPQLRLYAQDRNANFVLLKLRDYLECYIGIKSFIVEISYSDKKVNLSVLV